MRKLLALMLVTALIPFLTGCRVDGLWGYDDDDGTVTVANNANLVVRVPQNQLPASVRGATQGNINMWVKTTSGSGWELMTKQTVGTDILFGISIQASELALSNGSPVFRIADAATFAAATELYEYVFDVVSVSQFSTGAAVSENYGFQIGFPAPGSIGAIASMTYFSGTNAGITISGTSIMFTPVGAGTSASSDQLPEAGDLNAGDTRLTGWTINGVAAVASLAANVPVSKPGIANFSEIELTFSANLATQVNLATFVVRLERFSSEASRTAGSPRMADYLINGSSGSFVTGATPNTVKLNFSQAFEAGGYYKVSWVSGEMVDVNGNHVVKHPPILFNTAP